MKLENKEAVEPMIDIALLSGAALSEITSTICASPGGLSL